MKLTPLDNVNCLVIRGGVPVPWVMDVDLLTLRYTAYDSADLASRTLVEDQADIIILGDSIPEKLREYADRIPA